MKTWFKILETIGAFGAAFWVCWLAGTGIYYEIWDD